MVLFLAFCCFYKSYRIHKSFPRNVFLFLIVSPSPPLEHLSDPTLKVAKDCKFPASDFNCLPL